MTCAHGDALRVVAGGCGDDALRALLVGEVGDHVVGPAELERKHRLHVLSFQQNVAAHALR